jgi:hypothetical protein
MTLFLALVVGLIVLFVYMVTMPGDSYEGALPPLDDVGQEMARRLESHVNALCSYPAGRNYIERKGLAAARDYIVGQFESAGYQVEFQEYQLAGEDYTNIEVTRLGGAYPDEIIVVGAHYDAVIGAPGATITVPVSRRCWNSRIDSRKRNCHARSALSLLSMKSRRIS